MVINSTETTKEVANHVGDYLQDVPVISFFIPGTTH